MDLGVELITENGLWVYPEDFFKLELYVEGHLLPHSAGTDTYNCSSNIRPHKVVAATSPVTIADEDLSGLQMKLCTNKVLDQAELKHGFSLRIHLGQSSKDLLLARPDVPVYWEERGTFMIMFGEQLKSA
jgi:hypothetical protein